MDNQQFPDKRLNRLKWACRRGMLELDVLFLPFVEQAFDTMSFSEKETFERLLTCDDPDLFAWFMGHKPCKDPDLSAMVKHVKTSIEIKAEDNY